MAKQMSKEGYAKLEKELDYLKSIRRAEVAQKLKEARAFGDLSENAEYDEAKNEQGILEANIAEMEKTLENAIIVDNISVHEVGMGSVVELLDMKKNQKKKFQIVGTNEASPVDGKISDESPIGKAVMKKKVGERFTVEAPVGTLEFEVLDISLSL
jgi:transcription elongation factor GreA